METKHRPLISPSDLEKSTRDDFGHLFRVFYRQCGYSRAADEELINAYWMKLFDYPEKILMDMFDIFLNNNTRRCPPVNEMVDVCNAEYNSYRLAYAAQENKQQEEKREQEDEDDPDKFLYREAVRHAVLVVLANRDSWRIKKSERYYLVKQEIIRVSKERGRDPQEAINNWIPAEYRHDA